MPEMNRCKGLQRYQRADIKGKLDERLPRDEATWCHSITNHLLYPAYKHQKSKCNLAGKKFQAEQTKSKS